MIRLFQKYASVIRFIFTFVGSYLLMALIYHGYLMASQEGDYYPDFLTHLVALQSEALVEGLGYEASIRSGYPEATLHLLVNEHFVARIIEGCNAASIIILFIAFMIAFFGKSKPTLLYLLVGTVFIYIINLVRIALMAIGIYEYPDQAHFLHTIAFPLVIYGAVFLLWILWIRLYSKQYKI